MGVPMALSQGQSGWGKKMASFLFLILRLQLHVIILYSCTRLHRNFSNPLRCSGHDVTHLRNIPTWSSQHSANLSQLVLTCSVFARLNSRRRWNEEPKWRRAAKKVACCTRSAVIVSVPWTWWGCVHTNNEVPSRINTNKQIANKCLLLTFADA